MKNRHKKHRNRFQINYDPRYQKREKRAFIIIIRNRMFFLEIERRNLTKADGGREKELRIIISFTQSSINHSNMAAGAGRSDRSE
jgi:hypothetical protein